MRDLKGNPHELFILAVSVLFIVNMVFLAALSFKCQPWWLIAYVAISLTLIFLSGFRLPHSTWTMLYAGLLILAAGLSPALAQRRDLREAGSRA